MICVGGCYDTARKNLEKPSVENNCSEYKVPSGFEIVCGAYEEWILIYDNVACSEIKNYKLKIMN